LTYVVIKVIKITVNPPILQVGDIRRNNAHNLRDKKQTLNNPCYFRKDMYTIAYDGFNALSNILTSSRQDMSC